MTTLWKGILAVGAAAALGAGAAALPGPAGGATHGRRFGHGPHGPGGRLGDHVGLTDEQKATWEQMHQEFREAAQPRLEELRASMKKLRETVEAEDADPAAVGRLVLSMHKQRQQLKAQHEALEQRLRSVLTPEQQAKYDAFQAAHPRRHWGPGVHGFFGPGAFGPGRPGGPHAPEAPDDFDEPISF